MTPAELLDLAQRAAAAGAGELLPRYGGPAHGLASKSSGTDLVSDADRAAEAAIQAVIRAARPHDAMLAEEGSGGAGTSGLQWVVDPLDGTTNYLWGIPHWAVSVAVRDAGGPVAAVVLHPTSGEVFTASRGGGAHLDGRALRMPSPPPLAEALVGTGFNYSPGERARQARRMAAVLPAVRDIRRFGAAALDLAWLAAGRLDAFFERGVQVWDWAAGELLVREAGGAVAELAPTATRPGGVVAAHPALLEEVRRLFEDAP